MDDVTRQRIKRLYASGYSPSRIANVLDLPESVVRWWLAKDVQDDIPDDDQERRKNA